MREDTLLYVETFGQIGFKRVADTTPKVDVRLQRRQRRNAVQPLKRVTRQHWNTMLKSTSVSRRSAAVSVSLLGQSTLQAAHGHQDYVLFTINY